MYEYIQGELVSVSPTYAVVDCGGIGYLINISVNTFGRINQAQRVKLFIHYVVREDAQLLYGFADMEERAMFRLLISISGIGANTACVMLSSMTVADIVSAVQTENVNAIKSVKGIGLKTAQRVIIELKDKVAQLGVDTSSVAAVTTSEPIREEALAALVMLGFVKAQAAKVLDKLIASGENYSVELLIKQALKSL